MSSTQSRSRQRGFSLVEVMVATAILVIVMVGILTLYDRANRVFKSGNESAEMQQNVRIAYERMLGDIRMAGFDYKRGGPLLPQQQPAPWAATRQYSSGTIIVPTTPNGLMYRAANDGTTGTTEPSWPTSGTVVESGATPPITWVTVGGTVYEQPDEQIEYAGATAVTIRANFNYSVNPIATDHGEENGSGGRANLESSQFPMVTTGNDEIVTYALRKTGVAAGTAPNNQSVNMFLDINAGGTAARTAYPGSTYPRERAAAITGVDLTNNNPPYTLYRFTFDADGSVVATPLADNIRSMNFFYYQDTQGVQPLTDTAGNIASDFGGAGQYDAAAATGWNDPNRLVRRRIRAIRVRLIGMNSNPDLNYTDSTTANGQFSALTTAGVPQFVADTAGDHYRRLTVDTLVVPRNLGMTGMPQNFLTTPPAPTMTSVCIGYCGIAVLSWNPNTSNPNESYVVSWDTDLAGNFAHSASAGTANTLAIDLTQQDLTQTFYFRVTATNAAGSVISTNTLSAQAINATTPSAPNILTVSGGGGIPPISGKVHVAWPAPVTNAGGTITCNPSGIPPASSYLREIKGFRIFRDTSQNFNASGTTAGSGNCIVDENAAGPGAPQTDGYGNYTYDDQNVACGQTYYYRVQTVEWCVVNAAYNTSGISQSVSDYYPVNSNPAVAGQSGTTGTPQVPVRPDIAPVAPAAPPIGMTNSVCNSGMNTCTPINMRFQKVTLDTTGNPVAIDTYDYQRRQILNGVPGPWVLNPNGQITGAIAMPGNYVTKIDTAPEHDSLTLLNYSYEYQVRAVQQNPCPTGGWSQSAFFPPPCTFSGSVVVETGASSGDGLTPASAWVMNGGDTIEVQPPVGTTLVNTTMQIVDPGGTLMNPGDPPVLTSPADFSWANLTPGTPYTVTFTMTNDQVPPCTEQLVRYIEQEPLPACSLTTFATQNAILAQTATNYQLRLQLVNASSEALTISEIDFDWTPPTRIKWNSVQFPSGAAITGPGTSGGAFVVNLNPRPGTVTVGDVTVPAGGTQNILLNFARTNGNPSNVTAALMNSICVQYTRASEPGFIFHCQILPDANVNNPNSCQ